MKSAFTEVEAVLQDYFDSLYTCNVETLSRVFHPLAIYATADESPTLIRHMRDYFEVVAAREPGASRGETRKDSIDAIDFAGDKTAFARVRCRIGQRDFIDFLTLIRDHDRWQIISKVFHFTETR